MLAIDNGSQAAPGWGQRVEVGRELIQQAGREGREVLRKAKSAVARRSRWPWCRWPRPPTCSPRSGPEPWPVDRAGAAQRLAALDLKDAVPVWLSDRGALGDSPRELVAADHLGQALSRLGPLKTYAAPPAERAALLRPPDDKVQDVAVTV